MVLCRIFQAKHSAGELFFREFLHIPQLLKCQEVRCWGVGTMRIIQLVANFREVGQEKRGFWAVVFRIFLNSLQLIVITQILFSSSSISGELRGGKRGFWIVSGTKRRQRVFGECLRPEISQVEKLSARTARINQLPVNISSNSEKVSGGDGGVWLALCRIFQAKHVGRELFFPQLLKSHIEKFGARTVRVAQLLVSFKVRS